MNHKILIVDDSPLLRATARQAVQQAGVRAENVFEAENGKQALELLGRQAVDIVLLDLNMPVMDGFEFVERKIADKALAGVRVVLVTTEGNRQRLSRLNALGVAGYLHKPFEPEDLRALVRNLCKPES